MRRMILPGILLALFLAELGCEKPRPATNKPATSTTATQQTGGTSAKTATNSAAKTASATNNTTSTAGKTAGSTIASSTPTSPDDPAGTTGKVEEKPKPSRAPKRGTTNLKKVKFDPSWTFVVPSKADAKTTAQMKRAKVAMKIFGQEMLRALVKNMTQDGAEATVRVCAEQAPKIAQNVRSEHLVKVGRVSFKTRNAKNPVPTWTRPIVDARFARPIALKGKDGRLGFMKPIYLMDLCTSCHGEANRLDKDALATIKKLYPKDQATGFVPGDLRGWFWVEVPKM